MNGVRPIWLLIKSVKSMTSLICFEVPKVNLTKSNRNCNKSFLDKTAVLAFKQLVFRNEYNLWWKQNCNCVFSKNTNVACICADMSQCENSRISLSVRFYVKLISATLEAKKLQILNHTFKYLPLDLYFVYFECIAPKMLILSF